MFLVLRSNLPWLLP